MVTKNVVLTEAQATLVDNLVASGRYQNASEALRAGLRLLEREEAETEDLRLRLTHSLDQARRGELAEGSGAEAICRAFQVAVTEGVESGPSEPFDPAAFKTAMRAGLQSLDP